jgi:hypothetical protein
MAPSQHDLRLDDETAGITMVVAMTVRNAMEDFHHEHLTDEQMATLNPIIRDGIATGLYALAHGDDSRCRRFVDFQARMIPDYWERPELLDDLTELRP